MFATRSRDCNNAIESTCFTSSSEAKRQRRQALSQAFQMEGSRDAILLGGEANCRARMIMRPLRTNRFAAIPSLHRKECDFGRDA